MNKAWEKVTGEKLFVEAKADIASDYRRFAEVFSIMRDNRQWQPEGLVGHIGIPLDRP